eukprot:8777032-Lingulodinium_polyedra.AAC.1
MHGTSKASKAFGQLVGTELKDMAGAAFASVDLVPMTFTSAEIQVDLLVHGDDFFAVGRKTQLEQLGDHLGD